MRRSDEIKATRAAELAEPAEQLMQLAETFRSSLPDLLARIEEHLHSLGGASPNESDLNEAIMLAHQIRGTAGTLGLRSASLAFGSLEDQLELLKAHRLFKSDAGHQAIATTLELCRSLLQSQPIASPTAHVNNAQRIVPLANADASAVELNKMLDESQLVLLLIEDDPHFINIVQAVLSSKPQSTAILSARTVAQAEAFLNNVEPDLILLDLNLPDSKGIDTFYDVKKSAPDVPILILTAIDDMPIADELVACGAQDYLVKGRITPDSLDRCIRYSLTRFRAEQSMMRLHAIDDFVSTLAHDLRVPAQGADILLKHILGGHVSTLTPELHHALTVLETSNSELLDKLSKLIDLYNIEFGTIKPVFDMVAILPLLEKLVQRRTSDAQEKEIKVEIRNDGPVEKFCAYTDVHFVEEVLAQVIDNAIKFSPRDDSILIELEKPADATKSGDNRWLTITVSNHGPAIPSKERKGLFKKFWRGTPGVSYVSNSGLGLYSCHKILKILDGTITCRSDEQRTAFTIRLPLPAPHMVSRSDNGKKLERRSDEHNAPCANLASE